MRYRCAKCRKAIKASQPSIFYRFEHYHLNCLGASKRRMAVVRK